MARNYGILFKKKYPTLRSSVSAIARDRMYLVSSLVTKDRSDLALLNQNDNILLTETWT